MILYFAYSLHVFELLRVLLNRLVTQVFLSLLRINKYVNLKENIFVFFQQISSCYIVRVCINDL